MRNDMNMINLDLYSKDVVDGKRKRQELPDGSGWGDHIQLLQIFESWDQTGYDTKWCSHHDLQVTEKNMFLICLVHVCLGL
jgi:hypothetical protein